MCRQIKPVENTRSADKGGQKLSLISRAISLYRVKLTCGVERYSSLIVCDPLPAVMPTYVCPDGCFNYGRHRKTPVSDSIRVNLLFELIRCGVPFLLAVNRRSRVRAAAALMNKTCYGEVLLKTFRFDVEQ